MKSQNMKTIKSPKKMSQAAREIVASGQTVALVPTMGALHEGHLALVDRARRAADVVVVSIFVNPTQFGPDEDYLNYPRDTRRDLALLRKRRVGFVFLPQVKDMYPDNYETYVTVENLTQTLEGKARPGHFRGVTTIVAKLFNICRPDVVVFGQKDYQQAAVLKKMTADLAYPITFVVAPTVRERDGLALSSRNQYFSAEQRKEAVCLSDGLRAAKKAFRAGETSVGSIRGIIAREAKKVCPTVKFEYIAATEYETLTELKKLKKGAMLSLAAKVHNVRLIDNLRL